MKQETKKWQVLLLASCLSLLAMAQEEAKSPWSYNGLTGLNLSQTSLTNWAEGGENSTSGNLYFNGSLNYVKDNVSWTNDLNANFGLLRTQSQADWRKNMDNLNFASKYGRTLFGVLYYAALLDFKTQFAPGYDYVATPKKKLSDFMTPAYLNLSVGIDYKPSAHLSAYYSPISMKMTYVNDTLFSQKFGVEQGKKVRTEMGSNFKASVSYDFWEKKISLKSNVDLFTAYNESFGNVDVNWNMLLGFNFTKFLSMTLQANLKYDDDIKTTDADGNQRGAKVQLKEVFGVGLSYRF